jgi:protein TonB
MFDNENGQDRFRSETTPKHIRVEELDDYIDQAISDGMKIRKVRLSMQPDVPMGPIFDLKETLRYRMLLNLVMESYKEPALVSQNSPFVPNESYDQQKADEDVFNGKLPEMVQYIQDNISYPDEAKQDSNSNVLASFTIGKDGNVMNPEIIGSADPALDEEALKVLSQMPTWIPARNENGEEIEVKYTIPVSSSLPADF